MSKKILLIENDTDIRDMIAFILEEAGFSVLHHGPTEDPSSLIEHQADLILIDEWLSGNPGHRLCLRIKQLESLTQTPVIILSTASNIEEIMQECRADDFICKPFDLTDLLEKVHKQTNTAPNS